MLAICLDNQVARKRAAAIVTGADFDEPAHEVIWDAMSSLDRHKRSVDPTTVMTVLAGKERPLRIMPEIVGMTVRPESVDDYGRIIRSAATKRRIANEARRTLQQAENPDTNGESFAVAVANRFAGIRDSGSSDDIEAKMLGELLNEPDEPYDWLVPGVLERSDRFILTGDEGLGKSMLLRQIALAVAAGLHPFNIHSEPIEPRKAVIIDVENTWRQTKRKLRDMYVSACKYGDDPSNRVMIECPGRMDITRDRDLAHVHKLLDASQPDVLVIGPIYKLVPRALQTDDEAAPLLTALDTIRDRGIALLIEAHAGHTSAGSSHGGRNLRPRGSAALLGWPEFGYGMARGEMPGEVELAPWRGDRDERHWPDRMDQGGVWPWTAVNYHGKAVSG